MRIIVGVESIRAPISGIGVYCSNLCHQFLKEESIELYGLTRFGLLDAASLRLLINQVAETANDAIGPPKGPVGAISSIARESDLARYIYHRASQLASRMNLRRVSADAIYHAPNFIGYGDREKKVVTVHDLSHMRYPEMHPGSRVNFMNKWLERSVNEAGHVIVDTEFTRQELLNSRFASGVDESKVSTVHLGVSDIYDDKFRDSDSITLEECGLTSGHYFLALGTIEPRKNYERLVRAYLSLPPEIAQQFPLVICGAKGWKYGSLDKLIDGVSYPYRVVLAGHLSRERIIALMRHCRAFVYPSLYEGFGLPILEAMKCGVPVITSNIGAMAEVAGDAAHLVEPTSVESIQSALKDCVVSDSLRNTLRTRGQKRVKKFSWESCAKETLRIYQKL